MLYAERLSLTVRGQIAPAGQMLLALPDQGARRWLLTLEMQQSLGRSDPWRVHRRELETLLKSPSGSYHEDAEYRPFWPNSRLEALDLVAFWDNDGYAEYTEYNYALKASEQAEVRAILDPDGPMWTLARSLTPDASTVPPTATHPLPLAGLREAGRAAAELGRTASHELRNVLLPMDASRDRLSSLIKGTTLETEARSVLEDMHESVKRLWRYADWFKHLGEDLDRPPARFGARASAEEAIQLANGAAVDGDLAVSADVSILGYRDRFVLALVNLFRNARQSGATKIRLAMHTDKQQLFVEVEDNGPGVPPEDEAMVFVPSFTTRQEGTGEGLAIVRTVVEEEHRGSIGYSRSPGLGGARFSIRIPI